MEAVFESFVFPSFLAAARHIVGVQKTPIIRMSEGGGQNLGQSNFSEDGTWPP